MPRIYCSGVGKFSVCLVCGLVCAQAQGLFALNPRWAIAMGYTKAIHKGL